MKATTIKATPLNTLKLRLVSLLIQALGLEANYTLRFLPTTQKRLDTRGRTLAIYESPADAIRDLHEIHDGIASTKEPEHGSYYLSFEIRSASVHRLGAGRKNRDTITVPLPLSVPQGVSATPQTEPAAAHAAKAPHDAAQGASGDGDNRGRQAGHEAPPGPDGPVGQVKVNLSTLGVR